MKIIRSEQTSFWDVDGTLILPYDATATRQVGRTIDVWDCVTQSFIRMVAHEPMVRLLIEEKSRGAWVIVWSRGGYQWAADVVRALDLVGCVDEAMSKPMAYFDDKDISEWLPYRVWLDPKMNYKQTKVNKNAAD